VAGEESKLVRGLGRSVTLALVRSLGLGHSSAMKLNEMSSETVSFLNEISSERVSFSTGLSSLEAGVVMSCFTSSLG